MVRDLGSIQRRIAGRGFGRRRLADRSQTSSPSFIAVRGGGRAPPGARLTVS